MKLLHVDSSIMGEASISRQLTAEIVSKWRSSIPEIEIIRRDLAASPLSHLSNMLLSNSLRSRGELTVEQQSELDASELVLTEFLEAKVVVVGAPMYNFTVPSQLKAWIDRLAVAGRTFRYTATGAEGLAGDKTVIIASSRGGFYAAETTMASFDFQEQYLKRVFAFFGISDISIVRAEGVSISAAQKERSLADARRNILERL